VKTAGPDRAPLEKHQKQPELFETEPPIPWISTGTDPLTPNAASQFNCTTSAIHELDIPKVGLATETARNPQPACVNTRTDPFMN